MKQTQFVKSNSVSWDEFEALCEQNNAESLPVNFPNLYRKVCNEYYKVNRFEKSISLSIPAP